MQKQLAHSRSYYCCVCGKNSEKWIFKKIISGDLARSWKLSKKMRKKFDLRESQFCPNCGNSARTRIFAYAIMDAIPIDGVKNLKDWVTKSKQLNLSVAEINSCGKLHNILSDVPNIAYSEYPPARILPRIYFFIKRVRKEDITNLSYPDKSFDLVLHSEVLEHVPNVDKAISECRRILNPKGICLFTAPLIPKRHTKQCAVFDKKTGEILHLKTPSFHGLDDRADNMVWWEFGHDFLTKYRLKKVVSNPQLMTYVFLMRKYD